MNPTLYNVGHQRTGGRTYLAAAYPHVYVLGWADSFSLTDSISFPPPGPLSDTFSLTDSFHLSRVLSFSDTLGLTDSAQEHLVLTTQTLADVFGLTDAFSKSIKLFLSDTFGLTDSVSIAQIVLTLKDFLSLQDSFVPRVTVTLTQADVLSLADKFGLSYQLKLADTFSLVDSWTEITKAFFALSDTFGLTDSFASYLTINLLVKDTFSLQDTSSWSLAKTLTWSDTIGFTSQFTLGAEQYLAWVLNTRTAGAYKFLNFPFNSFGRVAGKNLMCAPDGIYELGGDSDNGTLINASLRTGRMDFANKEKGIEGDTLKQLLSAYLLFSSDGAVLLKVTTSRNGQGQEDWYKLTEKPHTLSTKQLPLSPSIRSTLWQFELSTLEGIPANFKAIEVIPLYLSRRV